MSPVYIDGHPFCHWPYCCLIAIIARVRDLLACHASTQITCTSLVIPVCDNEKTHISCVLQLFASLLWLLWMSWLWLHGSWIAITAYHHQGYKLESRSWRGVIDTTLCNKVCQWLAAGRWFSPDILVYSTNKTDHHYLAKILFKVALSNISLNLTNTLKK